jgi:hypothetical protein
VVTNSFAFSLLQPHKLKDTMSVLIFSLCCIEKQSSHDTCISVSNYQSSAHFLSIVFMFGMESQIHLLALTFMLLACVCEFCVFLTDFWNIYLFLRVSFSLLINLKRDFKNDIWFAYGITIYHFTRLGVR